MERGPMALFGAIIAVGLGPAMWLGAQFGNVSDVPSAPPAVRSEHRPDHAQDKGGAAGSAPEDPTAVLDTDPRADIKPLNDPARPQRSASNTTTSPGKDKPSAEPSESSSAPATGDDSSPPPSESTDPADPPSGDGGGSGGGDDGPVQPSPPADSAQGGGTG
jgi:hypothetical protein